MPLRERQEVQEVLRGRAVGTSADEQTISALPIRAWKLRRLGQTVHAVGKAFAQLTGMKQRGIMQPADEKYLAVLRAKAGSSAK